MNAVEMPLKIIHMVPMQKEQKNTKSAKLIWPIHNAEMKMIGFRNSLMNNVSVICQKGRIVLTLNISNDAKTSMPNSMFYNEIIVGF